MGRDKLKRKDAAADREPGYFAPMPVVVLKSRAWSRLSPYAVKLILDLVAQFNGHNNGDFCAAWSVMRGRGWRSKGTLGKSISELISARLLVVTRQGGRHKPTLYAVTFHAIHLCGGKLDLRPRSWPDRSHLGSWRRNDDKLVLVPPLKRPPETIPLPHVEGQSRND